jgi:cytochrome oxidase Cu insertion factor (SCO1/SenC/PrrC family)
MNRKAFLVSFAAFLVSGAIFAAVGIKVMTTLRDGRPAAVGHGSESAVDAEYQKLPADSQAEWMDGFTLTERSGREVHWRDLAGKVRVVSFFFSSCPANCLRQNQKIGEIQRAYAGKDVVCVSITCDPDTDSPERLREYAAKLEAPKDQWLFLTGRLIYIRRVASEVFKVALDKQTHTERLIVCDKWGNMRGSFLWNKLDEVAELRLLVDKLLAEMEPPGEKGTGDREQGTADATQPGKAE